MEELLKACESGDIATVRDTVEEYNIELQSFSALYNTTPLHCAARHGHLDIVKYLVEENGCDVKSSDDFSSTPFIHAALGGKLEVIKYLLSKGGSDLMRPPCAMGRTALHTACLDDRLEVVKFFVANGADPSCRTDIDVTPLHMAAGGGALSVVKYLTEEKECDPKCSDESGNTPLHNSALGNAVEVLQYLISRHSCDPMCRNFLGRTPLHIASRSGHLNVVRSLVEDNRVAPTCRDDSGNTPLHAACLFGHLSVVKYLIEDKRCDPEVKNNDGVTPEKIVNEENYVYCDITSYVRTILTVTLCEADLKPFTVKAQTTGQRLGRGSFGEVIELVSGGKKVAGKIFNVSSTACTRRSIMKKIIGEITHMLRIQHTNIVMSRTVCFLPGNSLPVLMMELMMSNLHTYMLDPDNAQIPLQKKLSFLCDVARGLNHLHNLEPAIVHRDLTAKNVLLTSDLCAKISDFGNARVMDLDPDADIDTLTACPGTIEYMPPEALGIHHHDMNYGKSLDVFSFGHLALFVLTQSHVEILPPTYHNDSGVHGLSEVCRRHNSIDRLNTILISSQPLFTLIKNCLHNKPEERPHIGILLAQLQEKILGTVTTKEAEQEEESSDEKDSVRRPRDTTCGPELVKTEKVLPYKLLFERLYPVRARWYTIGICLDISPGDLDAIATDHSKDGERCLSEVLYKWTKIKSHATWEDVILMLMSRAMKEVNLAKKIKQEFKVETSLV